MIGLRCAEQPDIVTKDSGHVAGETVGFASSVTAQISR